MGYFASEKGNFRITLSDMFLRSKFHHLLQCFLVVGLKTLIAFILHLLNKCSTPPHFLLSTVFIIKLQLTDTIRQHTYFD
jgi:hypothetical protein